MWPFDIFKKKSVSAQTTAKVESQAASKHQPTTKKEGYLIVFSATWCGPSKSFLKEIGEAGLNYSLLDVDKDEFEDLTTKYNINSIPTTILMDKDENVINRWHGYDDEDPGQSKLVRYVKSSGYTLIHYPGSESPSPAPTQNPTSQTYSRKSILSYKLEDLKSIRMGSNLTLVPYDAGWMMESSDVSILTAMANTPAIQRYLPGLDFSSEDATKKTLAGLCMKTENFFGFSYAIRMGQGIMGMICLDSPFYNKGILHKDIWTMDFFALPIAEHKGIMLQAIIRILNHMKTVMNVEKVYVLVEPSNRACLNLVNNGLFTPVYDMDFHNTKGGEDPIPFVIDLRTINFQHR